MSSALSSCAPHTASVASAAPPRSASVPPDFVADEADMLNRIRSVFTHRLSASVVIMVPAEESAARAFQPIATVLRYFIDPDDLDDPEVLSQEQLSAVLQPHIGQVTADSH